MSVASALRVFLMPLCAALAAALFAHVGIDLLGDYLLPHDAYDDLAHGSRSFVVGGVAVACVSSLAFAIRAAIREAGGSVDAFGRALRTSVALPRTSFVLLTLFAAGAILAGMEIADAAVAGRVLDDVSDLLGGSATLGLATLVVSSIACASGLRKLVLAIAHIRRTFVRAVALVFSSRKWAPRVSATRAFERIRLFADSCSLGKSRSGRAPPAPLAVRPFSHTNV